MTQIAASVNRREQTEAAFAALNARDFDAIDSRLAIHPDLEIHSVIAQADGDGVFRGSEGARLWAEAVDPVWANLTNEILDYRELDDERVLLTIRLTGRAIGSGVPLDTTLSHLWTWKDGQVWRIDVFNDRRDALAVAGVAE